MRSSLVESCWLIVDELGMIYAYPDDPAFQDALTACGVHEGKRETLADRDYIKVFFQATADREEVELLLESYLQVSVALQLPTSCIHTHTHTHHSDSLVPAGGGRHRRRAGGAHVRH